MSENGAPAQFGRMPNGTEYPIPASIVIKYLGDGEQEHELRARTSDKGSHVFYCVGKDLKEREGGFQINVTVTKIKSGDPVLLEKARKEREKRESDKLRAEKEALQRELDELRAQQG